VVRPLGSYGTSRSRCHERPRLAYSSSSSPPSSPVAAAAVARGSGCGAKPRQRRRAGAFRTLGYARPIVQVAPERSRAMVRRIFSTADRQGAEEVTHGKAHLRASARPDLKRWGHRGAPKGHVSSVQRGPTVPPSPYHLGAVQSWRSISAAPAGRVVSPRAHEARTQTWRRFEHTGVYVAQNG
jgi:hypothetical protein